MSFILLLQDDLSYPQAFAPRYRRSETLRHLWLTTAEKCSEPLVLISLFGVKTAIRIILEVRRKLKRLLAVVRWQGKNRRWYYDHNHHLAVAEAFREETALAQRMTRLYYGARRHG